jgi:hypothetical protein
MSKMSPEKQKAHLPNFLAVGSSELSFILQLSPESPLARVVGHTTRATHAAHLRTPIVLALASIRHEEQGYGTLPVMSIQNLPWIVNEM